MNEEFLILTTNIHDLDTNQNRVSKLGKALDILRHDNAGRIATELRPAHVGLGSLSIARTGLSYMGDIAVESLEILDRAVHLHIRVMGAGAKRLT